MRSLFLVALAFAFLFTIVPTSGSADDERAPKRGGDAPLTPTKLDRGKLQQAKKLRADYEAGKLDPADAQQYQGAIQRLEQAARRGRSGGGASGMGSLAGGDVSQSCKCTATCQTIVIANGTEYNFEGTGTVSSPSACADAAEEFCSNAYSSFLLGWNCK